MSTFQIYNASAGSGKTYTLVKSYLKLLLGTDDPHRFKRILAVTFTNKAVYEMKHRILQYLYTFSQKSIITAPSEMCMALCDVLHTNPRKIHQRAVYVQKQLLHNYAFFDVVTIDAFNHRIIRTFAHDLKLPSNFEVALDTKPLLEEAVDNLIHKAGDDEQLTRILVDFAIEKADADKHWDIAFDLRKIAQLLLEENHYMHVTQLSHRTIPDFVRLGVTLKAAIKVQQDSINTIAGNALKLIADHHLETTDFIRGTLPNHFRKVASGETDSAYHNKLAENIAEGALYSKSLPAHKAAVIDMLLPELSKLYHDLKKTVFHLKFLQNFYKNNIPLSLLNAIKGELELLKEVKNIVLISEFNSIISNAIAHQPVPFIYERLGVRYHHYFIDEFQDTSRMQWHNLKPLISHALESENLAGTRGTLCIVGDAKQAIYRWRGGNPKQFIGLCRDRNPFHVEKEVISLPRNYRSYDKVVEFNNAFFAHNASFLSHPHYQELYKNNTYQKGNTKKGGMVTLSFIDKNDDDQRYCQYVLTHIQEVVEQGYTYTDICILTRTRKEGVMVAHYLLENNIRIVSSETLLLKNDPKVDFLINLMIWLLQPERNEHQVRILYFWAEKEQRIEKHGFLTYFLDNMSLFFDKQGFDENMFMQLPLFDAVEYAISTFALAEASDGYLQYFLDEIMDFVLKNGGGMRDFIAFWESKKDQLSIVAPQGTDAVQLMTIHKAKGLEFRIVIYPFAHTDIYGEQYPKVWLPILEEKYGFPYALLDKNKAMQNYGNHGAVLYDELQATLELDQFNILYVALTRAIERMYIITKKDLNSKGEENQRYFSGVFIHFLKTKNLWDADKTVYTFGTAVAGIPSPKKIEFQREISPFISPPLSLFDNKLRIITKAGSLWDTPHQQMIARGNLYHYLLSKITDASEVDAVIEEAFEAGKLTLQQKKEYRLMIIAVVEHKKIQQYYNSSLYTIYNERAIYTDSGIVIRPDRVAIRDRKVTIIDYKTGGFRPEYNIQVNNYAQTIEAMNLYIENKWLVFINDTVNIMAV